MGQNKKPNLKQLILDILFDNGGIFLESFFIEKLSKDIDITKETIVKRINQLISENKLYRFEDKYISLTDFGYIQEDKIDKLLSRLVYSKFLFKNPMLHNGKEFCDNMIFFDGILVIIQSKTKNYTRIEEFDQFRKKCIDDATKQLKSSINWAREDRLIKRFKNNMGEEIELTSNNIKKIIGVIVPYFHPDKDYFITKGNYVNSTNLEDFLNILTYQELVEIIRYNDTLPDFLEYIDKRRILVKRKTPLLSERKILSYFFLTNRTMVPEGLSESDLNSSLLLLDDNLEESLDRGDLYKKLEKREKTNMPSYFIDRIIKSIIPKIVEKGDTFFIELLNLNRYQRKIIAENILPAYFAFINKKTDFRAPFVSITNKEINFLFIFTRKFQSAKANHNQLYYYATLMKEKHKVDKIIAISENHYLNGSINFDFCILKGEINLDRSKLPPEILAKIDDTSTIIRIKSPSEFD